GFSRKFYSRSPNLAIKFHSSLLCQIPAGDGKKNDQAPL
ncbi:hypothetical protein AVDCRST_MAG84-281, partial [uncultured Microcoleus sp.]